MCLVRLDTRAKERPHMEQIWGLCFFRWCSFTSCIEDFNTPHTKHLYLWLLSAFFLSAWVFIFREPCVGDALLGLLSVSSTAVLVVVLLSASVVLVAPSSFSPGTGTKMFSSSFLVLQFVLCWQWHCQHLLHQA